MANYLFIESRDPFDGGGDGFACELARRLARDGAQVGVFLVQNGVLPARPGARADGLADLIGAGISVYADDYSLSERGIDAARLAHGIRLSSLDIVIDRMAEGWKVIWH
jgi:NAD(P)H-hydrate repair Nnr-like enzyme with NAD(P)H-hydrate epimerase domain